MDWKELKESSKIFMIGDLQNYSNDKLSSGEYSETKDDYIFECPYCINAYLKDTSYNGEYHKRKLYVTKDLSVGHCFRCDRIFLDKIKGSYDIDSIKVNYAYYQEVNSVFTPTKLNHFRWSLDYFYTLPEYNEEGVNYLINERHKYLAQLYKLLHFRFMNCNPVIPFYYKGEMIYYQIRYIHHSHGQVPYFSPPIDDKPAYVIQHGDNIRKFIICEGVFDAIACLIMYPDRIPFALLGSSITDYQLAMLRSYVPKDILIYLDETSLSNKVMKKVCGVIDYADIEVIESDGEDPEEKLKKILK